MFEFKCKYVDFLNVEREETFRFNLTPTEIMEKNLSVSGGLQTLLDKMTERQDVPSLSKFFSEFLEMSYGEISPDGRGFVKTPENWLSFKSTNAYNELYMKLLENKDGFANDFISGVLPGDDPKNAPNNQNILAIEKAKQMAIDKYNNNSVK